MGSIMLALFLWEGLQLVKVESEANKLKRAALWKVQSLGTLLIDDSAMWICEPESNLLYNKSLP